MKHFKSLLSIVVFALALTFTSCMNGDDNNSPQQWAGVVRANYNGNFIDASGLELVPNKLSYLNSDMAYIYCTIDEGQQITEVTKSLKITMLTDPEEIDARLEVLSEGDVDHNVSNAPIITLKFENGYTRLSPYFFDKNTLILPIGYKAENVTGDKVSAELKKHTFVLVALENEMAEDDTVLKLYLRHMVNDGDDKDVSRVATDIRHKAYNISEALSAFTHATRKNYPSKIEIITKESTMSDKLDHTSVEDGSYEIDYTKVVGK